MLLLKVARQCTGAEKDSHDEERCLSAECMCDADNMNMHCMVPKGMRTRTYLIRRCCSCQITVGRQNVLIVPVPDTLYLWHPR